MRQDHQAKSHLSMTVVNGLSYKTPASHELQSDLAI